MNFLALFKIPGFPVSASEHAERVDLLFFGLLVVSLFVLLVLVILITYSIVHYRAGSKADRSPIFLSPRKLEITWTILPTLAFIGLFAWGAQLYLQSDESKDDPEQIYVIGRQWMWEMDYPNGIRKHNQLVVPVGRPVELVMASEDVIHSFFMPTMRIKHDLVPGRYVKLSFTPTRVGIYPIFCAEYCGTKHSGMKGTLEVMEDADYQKWLKNNAPLSSLAQEGELLFATHGCAGCHMPGAAVQAPMLDGIYGKNIPLQGGEFVKADEQYLHDSILLPLKQIAAGYVPLMPSFQGQLDESEVLALVEYIKSLDATTRLPAKIRPLPEALNK